jgi:spore maturation protein CgeB
LICAPWDDSEALFRPGHDYLLARNPLEMRDHMRALQTDGALRRSLAEHGMQTIASRHTCAHRVDQLLAIVNHLVATPQVDAA